MEKYFFDGENKKGPAQNLRAKSNLLTREQLIQRNQEERNKREQLRRQNKAATRIQMCFKVYLSKKKLHKELRCDLKKNLTYLKNLKESDQLDLNLFKSTVCYLLLCYHSEEDSENLKILSHFYIKHKELICNLINSLLSSNQSNQQSSIYKQSNQWLYRLKKLILLNLESLFKLMFHDNQQQSSNFVPLRLIEVFTSLDFFAKICGQQNATNIIISIWSYLVKNNYFHYMRKIIETKVPAPYDENVAYTQMEKTIFELTIRPLNIQYNDQADKAIIVEFFKQYLKGPFSPVIRFHVFKLINEHVPRLMNFTCLSAVLKEVNSDKNEIILPQNIWTVYSVLAIVTNQIENLSFNERLVYLYYIKNSIQFLPNQHESDELTSSDDEQLMEASCNSNKLERNRINQIANETIQLLNSSTNVNSLNSMFKCFNESNIQEILSFSSIGYSILINNNTSVFENRLLYTLAFNSTFLRQLWKYIISVTSKESSTLLIQIISQGIPYFEWKLILPHLSFFCSAFNYLLPTNEDFEFLPEFYDEKNLNRKKFSTLPFSLEDLRLIVLILRDVSLGLIELAYRDFKPCVESRHTIKQENFIMPSLLTESTSKPENLLNKERARHWSNLFEVVSNLLRQLYNRNSRHQFCSESYWIGANVRIEIDNIDFEITQSRLDRFEKFVGLKNLSKSQLEELGPSMPLDNLKKITILKEIPFVIMFTDRVMILQKLIEKDKSNYGESYRFMTPGSAIDIKIRRNYLYEDAFEKLSFESQPNIKKHIRVQLRNTAELEEAGIDGGGLFRELICELLKTSFDPDRGFFKTTTDRNLYPNPSAKLVTENYLEHYFFIGRILGKAIYENMLVELPLSHFFLAKLLTKNQSSDIDIHYMSSLDPLMYKNLLYLKDYTGDISELGLDFTVVQSDLGESKIVELKENGAQIQVTAQNRIEYIHLMADYILNKQIRPHVNAFKQGLANCIDLDWIRMFSTRELSILISGAPTPIDLEDLKRHTNYSGGYNAHHITIVNFWKAVESFTERQKSQLLKFVTSCSRPPLLGFAQLHPSFTIQCAGKAEDRLPTASTCMNLLKLPEFTDWKVIRDKLIYSIESNSGFELS